MHFQFLGTGNARQVPCYGCQCLACERARTIKNFRRTPCSAKIQIGDKAILLDAGQIDLTERFPAGAIHTILLTHYHMDHVQGLFHLRWGKNLSIPVIGPDDPMGCDDLFKHPGILDFLTPPPVFQSFNIDNITITPLPLNHSKPTVGYFFDFGNVRLTYLTDTLGLPEDTRDFLIQNDTTIMILDCSSPPKDKPGNHNSLTEAIQIAEDVKPGHTYLTHIGHDLDNYLLTTPARLPAKMSLASDGQKLSVGSVINNIPSSL